MYTVTIRAHRGTRFPVRARSGRPRRSVTFKTAGCAAASAAVSEPSMPRRFLPPWPGVSRLDACPTIKSLTWSLGTRSRRQVSRELEVTAPGMDRVLREGIVAGRVVLALPTFVLCVEVGPKAAPLREPGSGLRQLAHGWNDGRCFRQAVHRSLLHRCSGLSHPDQAERSIRLREHRDPRGSTLALTVQIPLAAHCEHLVCEHAHTPRHSLQRLHNVNKWAGSAHGLFFFSGPPFAEVLVIRKLGSFSLNSAAFPAD